MSRSRCRRLQAAAPPRRPGLSRLSDSSICHLRDASNLLTETLPTAQSETAGTETPDAHPSFLTSFVSLCRVGLQELKTRRFRLRPVRQAWHAASTRRCGLSRRRSSAGPVVCRGPKRKDTGGGTCNRAAEPARGGALH